jgi:hypothetical protein
MGDLSTITSNPPATGGGRRKPMGSPAVRSRRLTARGVQAQPPAS